MRLSIHRALWTFVIFIFVVDIVIYLYHYRYAEKESAPRFVKPEQDGPRVEVAHLADDSEPQVSIPGVPYTYPDNVDFRIVLMTFKRAKALQTTLDALKDLELDGDSAALEIWIDKDEHDQVDSNTVKTAKAFKVCITFILATVIRKYT